MKRFVTLILFASAATTAHADAVVNVCGTDTQVTAPGQTNLAQAMFEGGLITFNCGSNVTIKLTRSYQIARDTTLDGGGRITLDGDTHRMFFGADRRFRLIDIEITDGGRPAASSPLWTPGGVIRGSLRVEMLRAAITRSQWPVWLYGGTLRVTNSRFTDNDGPVLHAPDIEVRDRSQFSSNRGAPIFASRGRVVITDSEFFSNTAAIRAYDCTLTILDSRFNSNSTGVEGGALKLGCDATIEESQFHNNRAYHGAAIYIDSRPRSVALRAVKFVGNAATETGGAISVENSARRLDLTMRHVTFTNNRARHGGALMLERSYGNTRFLTGTAVAFLRNVASEAGGGIYTLNAAVKLTRGVFVENRARVGGGAIYAWQQGPLTTEFANSLVVKNSAAIGPGFWGNSALFVNTTIAENGDRPVVARAPALLPIVPAAGTPASFPIRFVNTIVAGSFAGGCGPAVNGSPYVDGGNNLQYPWSSCGSSMASAPPLLGPYYVPWFFSPTKNAGNRAVCDAAPIRSRDFYNTRRPLTGENCTIGAVETSISYLIHRWTSRRDR